nr:hypothetical protein [Tanacetum cinerariifolium]
MSTREHEKRHRSRCSRSQRPSPSVFSRIRRERSRSLKQKLRKREGGVFKRLGDRGKSLSARSDSHNQQSYSRYTKAFSESEDNGGGYWKSRSKKKKPSREEDDLSQPWGKWQIRIMSERSRSHHERSKSGKEQPKTAKKEETYVKDKALAILMVQPWERVARQKITQSFSPNIEIFFPPLDEGEGTKGPLIIEAKIE